ncbi:MAG: CopG family transcriptional regulator [Candidatus Hydrogenedentota bacterium]
MGTTKATIYFDSGLYKAFKVRAAMIGTSVTEIVNEAVKKHITEDAMDLKTIRDCEKEEET